MPLPREPLGLLSVTSIISVYRSIFFCAIRIGYRDTPSTFRFHINRLVHGLSARCHIPGPARAQIAKFTVTLYFSKKKIFKRNKLNCNSHSYIQCQVRFVFSNLTSCNSIRTQRHHPSFSKRNLLRLQLRQSRDRGHII